MGSIRENVLEILDHLPPGTDCMAVFKTRTAEEVLEAIDAGIRILGGNYVQETAALLERIGRRASCHLIGHLQTNKVKKAVDLFDTVETMDSDRLARALNARCVQAGRTMDVLIEVNSGREPNKSGVMPDETESLARCVSDLPGLKLRGLMTMGPLFGDPEESRPYFRTTADLAKRLSDLGIAGADFSVLSMGMSHSYRVAVEEGATVVRIGTKIFGERS
jgi:pyridoxal phosphate enzyme (YggS family)